MRLIAKNPYEFRKGSAREAMARMRRPQPEKKD